LWSSVAYAVSQRTQEFAVRMTLGAHRSSLVALMLREGVRDALIAMTAGLILAAIGSRYITDLLYGVSSRDPLVFITVAAAIFTLATIASLLPAWRVSRIDPAVALRTD
jgi:putative ABC transport system permease protein